MRHAAGVRYFDFTPVLIVALASVIGARYLAIGTGDTELYLFAGMRAAVVISIRVFLFRGVAAAGLSRPPARRAVPPRPSASRMSYSFHLIIPCLYQVQNMNSQLIIRMY
jgi:hypothetical protein